MADYNTGWWRFWSADSWKDWWQSRGPWRAYRAQARQLDSEITLGESELSSVIQQLARVSQQVEWAEEVEPRGVAIRTAKAETGLAAVSGVCPHGDSKT